MGVDTNIYLPIDVDIEDIGRVMSILMGNKPKLGKGYDNSFSCCVGGFKFEHTNTPHMTMILFTPEGGKFIDGQDTHYCHFFYCNREEQTGEITNCLYPRSNPFWCALGKRLVQFFGGKVQFNDCGSAKGKNVYRSKRHCPVDRRGLTPHDGKKWNEYQKAMSELKPLTKENLDEVRKLTGYPEV